MPVTAKLSKAFYERLGDAAANELVDWLNAVDSDYRSQLRELNELNFARFDAKVEQRFAQMDVRFAKLEARVDQRFDAIESLLRQHMAHIDVRMAQFEARLMRWMLTFWLGTLGGLAALLWALVQAR